MLENLFIVIAHWSMYETLPSARVCIVGFMNRLEAVQGVKDSLSMKTIPRRPEMSASTISVLTRTEVAPCRVSKGNEMHPSD